MDGWNRRFQRGDKDIPDYYYDRPYLDDICSYYMRAWNDLVTERPIIATMASVTEGIIPRSKIKMYAEHDLGLIGDEVEFFIAVMRSVEVKSKAVATDPEMTDQAGNAGDVKKIMKRVAKPDGKSFLHKKPKVRHPR